MIGKSDLLSYRFYDQLKKMMEIEELKLKLLYKATRDGFKTADFHSRCDN